MMLFANAPLRAALLAAGLAACAAPALAQATGHGHSARKETKRAATQVTRVARTTEQAPVAHASGLAGPVETTQVKSLVSLYARRHGVPERLAHRIVATESRYNAALKGRAHFGLMQISLPTARQMGYAGAPQGLLDARTNLAHGMPYLANAWIVSGGDEARAARLYTRGYYDEAKRKGLVKTLRTARSAPVEPLEPQAVASEQ